MKNEFEYVEIIKPNIKEKDIKKHLNKIKKYFTSKSVTNINIEIIGIKKLAYETQGFNEGYYILFQGNYPDEKKYNDMSNWLNWRNKNFNKKYPEVLKNITVEVK